jgi:hypothetical protein
LVEIVGPLVAATNARGVSVSALSRGVGRLTL